MLFVCPNLFIVRLVFESKSNIASTSQFGYLIACSFVDMVHKCEAKKEYLLVQRVFRWRIQRTGDKDSNDQTVDGNDTRHDNGNDGLHDQLRSHHRHGGNTCAGFRRSIGGSEGQNGEKSRMQAMDQSSFSIQQFADCRVWEEVTIVATSTNCYVCVTRSFTANPYIHLRGNKRPISLNVIVKD